MNFRKRNKIKLPISSSDESNVKLGVNKIKPSLNFSEDESLDDFDDLPSLKMKKGARKYSPFPTTTNTQDTNKLIVSNVNLATTDNRDSYDSIYKSKNVNGTVLNLEDETELIDIEQKDTGDITSSNILSTSKIEEIKSKKENIRRKLLQSQDIEKGTPTERDYAKLLSSEERLDLLDTYKDNGGTAKANEYKDTKNTEDYTDNIVDDGKLALTKNEILLEKQKRKDLIEQAINENDNDSISDIWEKNIMQQGSLGNDSFKYNKKVRRPVLWKDTADFEGDSFIEMELSKSRIKLKTKQLQCHSLQKERTALIQKGKSLINEIIQ